jgi:hypothetical protein
MYAVRGETTRCSKEKQGKTMDFSEMDFKKRFDVLGAMHEHISDVRIRRNKSKYWEYVQCCLQMFGVLLNFTDIFLKIIM